MNELQFLKPVLTALALPPVPWLLLVLIGAWGLARRRRGGWVLVGLGTALLWLSSCEVSALVLRDALWPPQPPLSPARIEQLHAQAGAHDAAIVVLGAGLVPHAPEDGDAADLTRNSLVRLRYGVRLARQTGLPLGYSGGIGWAQREDATGPSEAAIAQRVAERDFGWPLAWIEPDSRDTRENAVFTVRLLRQAGVRRLVVVTHAWHMRRAVREFKQAAGGSLVVIAAPMGYEQASDSSLLAWLPSMQGAEQVRLLLREALGRAVQH